MVCWERERKPVYWKLSLTHKARIPTPKIENIKLSHKKEPIYKYAWIKNQKKGCKNERWPRTICLPQNKANYMSETSLRCTCAHQKGLGFQESQSRIKMKNAPIKLKYTLKAGQWKLAKSRVSVAIVQHPLSCVGFGGVVVRVLDLLLEITG